MVKQYLTLYLRQTVNQQTKIQLLLEYSVVFRLVNLDVLAGFAVFSAPGALYYRSTIPSKTRTGIYRSDKINNGLQIKLA